jgi:murein tripeptide amidase MpaA
MKKGIFLFIIIIIARTVTYCQVNLQTVAEKSDFKSTSNYNDVISYINELIKISPNIRIEKLATSVEGRDVPLLIVGNPLPLSPVELADDKRIVVYIQANIHAGEVEGKEATLMFVRDILLNKNPQLLKNVILLVCPLFNPDGNEKISPLNRTHQNGPVNGVGLRYNGQFLDLNRDAMKAESPEVQGVIMNVFNRWDPSVFMDCHTTNGSYHVEPVTFTWMVNPNGDNSLISYMRDRMMPEMSSILESKYQVKNCFYGEFIDMLNPDKGWILDASEPRYMSNYFGIRNRLGILNENYVYADYKSRVLGCYYLINSLTDYSATHKDEIKKLLHNVDQRTIARGISPAVADSFAIEYKARPAALPVKIRTFEAELVSDENGRKNYKKSDRQKDVSVPYYIDYYPSKSTKIPFAYIINTMDPQIIHMLKIHGIRIEKLSVNSGIEVQRFEIAQVKGASRLNQGHYTNNVSGRFLTETMDFQAGTIIVKTAQPLANVAIYLLEPQSNDGMLAWNFFDRYLVPQWGSGYNSYPVFKIMNTMDLKTVIMN